MRRSPARARVREQAIGDRAGDLHRPGEPIAEDLIAELQAKEIEAAVTSVECGADESFGVQLDQILGEEIGAEVARRGLDDS